MTIQDKSKRLFECLGEIFSIGLPEDRDIRGYHSDLLWYADLCSLHQCRLKGFDQQSEEFPDASEKTWLWVKKEAMPDPPQVPPVLEGWLDVCVVSCSTKVHCQVRQWGSFPPWPVFLGRV